MITIKAALVAFVIAVAGVAHADDYMTFTPSPVKPGGGSYQTRGGCTAHNAPIMPRSE
ncbi:MAG: hypothetical protein QM682_13525 [Paracoccus sp. (in: a-proteobacteria)]|uniref:hypothetical protein n=1 Tax=Paracoccus sp. TaxID=267 RepID=UPI0039E453A8